MAGSISFSGMASGLDTDSIVEAMTSTYQNRVDKSAKEEILLEWKQEIYKDVSSKVYNFYTGTVNKLRLESTFNKKLLTASNTTAIKLDSSSTVPSGTHTLSHLKMATSAKIQTHQMNKTSEGKSVTGSTKLSEIEDIEEGQYIEITDESGEKVTRITIGSASTLKSPQDDNRDVEEVFIGIGESISNFQSLLKTAIPSASVSFDNNASAFFISSSATGKSQGFTISGSTMMLEALGFSDGKETGKSTDDNYVSIAEDGITTIKATGTNASYKYNGITIDNIESNNISINGLKFTITSNTDEAITITSSTDVDSMVDTIKSFVDEYNNLIAELNDMINADSAGSYEPLLDEEKEAMTDSQIEKWEQKIKDSLLRNDSTLKSLTSSMRSILAGSLGSNSTYKTLSSIGITTSSDWTANGKLELDEDKLRAALTDKPDEVIKLFTANGDSKDGSTMGLGDKLYESLGNSFKRISGVKSSTSLFNDTQLTSKRTEQSKTTGKWEDRLEKMKELYYNKFTAMEKILSTLNSQTDSLTSLLSS